MSGRLKKTLFFAAAILAGLGLFTFLIWRTGATATYESLVAFGVLPCLGFIGISLLNFTLYSLRWQIIVNDMAPQHRLSLSRVFMHRMSGFAAGYLTPASQIASEPIRVAMLRTDGVPLKEATGSVVLDLVFEISAVVVFMVSGIVLAVTQGLGGTDAMVGAVGFIALLVVFLIAFFWRMARGSGFFSSGMRVFRLQKVVRLQQLYHWVVETEGLMSKFFVGKPLILAFIVLLSIVMVSFKAVETYFLIHFFGVDLTIRDTFLLATLPGIVLLLPVPAGLGVYEGSNAAIFSLLGLQLNAVAYTAIIRVRDFVFIMLGVMHAVLSGEGLFGKTKKQ